MRGWGLGIRGCWRGGELGAQTGMGHRGLWVGSEGLGERGTVGQK